MKRKKFVGILLFIVLLVGCSKVQTFDEFFHQEIKEMHKDEENYSYTLVHTELNAVHDDDAIAVFTEDNNHRGEQIYIAYFEKQNNQWEWNQTRGAEWNTPVKWSSMHQQPYIYSGPLSDNTITKVYAGEVSAKIITVEEGKRFWYAISPVKSVEVMTEREDGTKEVTK